MKALIIAAALAISTQVGAVPIYYEVPSTASTVANGSVIGYQRVTVGRHWTWHGKARKYSYVPLYSTAAMPIPEPQTYGMILAGLGLVALKVRRKA